jgi:hypothetical protein
MTKKIAKGIVCFIAFSLFGCVTIFKPVADISNVKGNTLAVISGINDEDNVFYADKLSQHIAKKSTFKVLTLSEIKSRWVDYPYNIRGPYNTAYFEIDPNYAKTDIERLKIIQKKLNVDNIYVVWTPTSRMLTGAGWTADVFETSLIGQFFSFPGPVEVGRSNFKMTYAKGFVIGVKVPRDPSDFFRIYGDSIADKIATELKKNKGK